MVSEAVDTLGNDSSLGSFLESWSSTSVLAATVLACLMVEGGTEDIYAIAVNASHLGYSNRGLTSVARRLLTGRSLLKLVSKFCYQRLIDLRDRIYALIGLAR